MADIGAGSFANAACAQIGSTTGPLGWPENVSAPPKPLPLVGWPDA
ncbi:hypothetical protein [uncultured Sphingomonas sp.]